MFTPSWLPWRPARPHNGRTRSSHSPAVRRRGTRLAVEQLEDRTIPSTYYAATASALIADISAANQAGGANTIVLTALSTSPYVLTAADNATDGGNGLPVIAANDNLTIQGNGDTIQRSTASGTPAFRLFDVAAGASLTLTNLTLANGQVIAGTGMNAYGGGIYSSGSLTLTNATLSSNSAQASSGNVYGGGLCVAGGTVTVTNGALSSNSAIGGNAYGGGVFVSSAAAITVTLTNVTLSSNSAIGGDGVVGGEGEGGGLYVAGGTVSLTNDTISSNSAVGGNSTGTTGT